jgi:predicted RNase H-like HicB family nuclease
MQLITRTFSVAIEKHPEGYLATFPALPGCHTWGKTYEDVLRHAQDAVAVYVRALAAHGDPIPEETSSKYPVSLGITVRTSNIARRKSLKSTSS